jgi:hypothetical protein
LNTVDETEGKSINHSLNRAKGTSNGSTNYGNYGEQTSLANKDVQELFMDPDKFFGSIKNRICLSSSRKNRVALHLNKGG